MKSLKRTLAMMLAILTLCGALSVSASAAVWRTGDFYQTKDNWTSAHTIYSSNRNAYSKTNVYVYGCSRGTGHSGACKNVAIKYGGWIRMKLRTTNGWQYRNVWISAGYRGGWIDSIWTIGNVPICLALGTSRMAQHWALEGVQNVRAIS